MRLTDLARNLRQARRDAGLSQNALAKLAGVSRVTVADIERGTNTRAKPETLERLASALSVTVLQLKSGKPVGRSVQRECVERFLRSAWVEAKPLSDEEIDWLRSLPAIPWCGGAPSDETLFWFVEGFRRRN